MNECQRVFKTQKALTIKEKKEKKKNLLLFKRNCYRWFMCHTYLHMKTGPTLLVIKKMQIKMTVRLPYTTY